jgi:GH25 family lysozyme M1 (1,4-beta-N-acetylmuramidase)
MRPKAIFPLARALWPAILICLTAAQAFAQRPLGVDVSHYDGSINWTSVKGSGISFAWAKATEGVSTGDAYFAANMPGAKAAGIYIGAYHFAHPESNNPTNEANYFWSVAGGYIKSDGLSLQPTLDYETFSAPGGIPVGATSYADWANKWCNVIVSKAAAAGVTVRPVIYTSTCGAGNLNTSVAQWIPWIANPSGLSAQTGSPWSSTSCNSASDEVWGSGVWSVWQYSWTTTVPGITIAGGGDVDVFNGTLAQLASTLVVVGTGFPGFTTQPVLQRAADTGGSVSLFAAASGAPPLTYQWFCNTTNVPNATNTTLALVNVQPANAGTYTLVVTNSSGSVTSSPVSLLVYPPQATVFADNFDANTAASWIVNTSSGDNSVAFSFDYSTLGIPSAPNSTNGSTRGVQLKANLSLGAVAAVSLSPANQSFAGDYRLHFDAWINVNGPFPGGGAGSTELLTAGIATAGNRTEWTGNASADGYYFGVNGDGGSGSGATGTADYNSYSNNVVLTVGTGDYWAGTDTSARDNANVYYTTSFPAGAAAPALQQSTYPQQTGSLNPGTFGLAWHDVIVSKRGTTVDWVVDGIRFATISNATFNASNVFIGFWDPFASLSSNNVINFGLVDNVRVETPAVPPAFTTQPIAQTVKLGTNVTFAAAATGLPAASYQWRLNGTNIPGATSTSYALAFVTATNTGNYSVLATNLAGSAASTNALLALATPAAARFSSIANAGSALPISFSGDAYWTYTIESSTNLIDWAALTNLTSTTGSFQFDPGPATNAAVQFFRARVGP